MFFIIVIEVGKHSDNQKPLNDETVVDLVIVSKFKY